MITFGFTDIHEEWKLLKREIDQRKKEYGSDTQFILNGDYFDHKWKPPIEVAEDMAKLLKHEYLYDPNFKVHFGNHDIQYFWPNNGAMITSGYSWKKAERLSKILTKKDRNQLKFFTFVGRYLVSHAGINASMVHPIDGVTEKRLNLYLHPTQYSLDIGNTHVFIQPGAARGGFPGDHGGILWQDWIREFLPIAGINQIVGHTSNRKTPVRKNHNKEINSKNYCFDSNNTVCFKIEDDKKVVFETIQNSSAVYEGLHNNPYLMYSDVKTFD